MSWQTYVDTNLVGTQKVTRAAIVGLDHADVWASTKGYTISPDECKALVAGYKNLGQVQASGLRLAGNKFFTIQATDRTILLKKQADGATIVKTKKAILVAEYAAPLQGGESTPVVESLADYLISVGY